MPELFIDGRQYQYRSEDANLLAIALSHGLDLPYFCWHPVLHSIGACRQCAVKVYKDEKDETGRILMSCMTPPKPGMRFSVEDPEAAEFRAAVIEWLMVNHPHDCPICDEGGECHLQDMTVMTGHTYRRYRYPKRTFRNQYLGPFVNHEMNRCIECYRCVRFYKDYAGGGDFDVFGWHDRLYFGRYEEGSLESEFSGNLVEICPTGVFTDNTLKRHYTRKWDLSTAPSICTHCGLGCNTIPGEREGELRRVYARYSHEVNGYFLCDRGRFGYEYANSDRRIRAPFLRSDRAAAGEGDAAVQGAGNAGGGASAPASAQAAPEADAGQIEEHALARAAVLLTNRRVIGIGSPRASVETNFALLHLVGADDFYHGVPASELRLFSTIRAILETGIGTSVQDAGRSDGVLVLGEDLHNSAPILALALRQAAATGPRRDARRQIPGSFPEWDDSAFHEAVQEAWGPVFVATPAATKLDAIARKTVRRAPEGLTFIARTMARAIAEQSSRAEAAQLGASAGGDQRGGAGASSTSEAEPGALAADGAAFAAEALAALRACKRPVVVCGTSCGSEELVDAAATLVEALRGAGADAHVCFTVPEANSMALSLLPGRPIEEARARIESGQVDTVVVVENDLTRRLSPEDFLGIVKSTDLLVIDHVESRTSRAAEVVLPAATVFEGDGTYINHEGRAQRAVQVYYPGAAVREGWRWLGSLEARTGRSSANPWMIIEALHAAMAEAVPVLSGVRDLVPPVDPEGAKLRIPRLSHRASGRTALFAARNIHEPPPPPDGDSPMSFSMEGRQGLAPPSLIARYWTPGWNSVQALNKFQTEVAGILKGGEPGKLLLGEPGARPAVPIAGAADAPLRVATTAGSADTPTSVAATAGRAEGIGAAARDEAVREPSPDGLTLIAATHIYGSEELSAFTPGVRELAPAPYIGLSQEEADGIGIAEGDAVSLTTGGRRIELPMKLVSGLAPHVALYPLGLAGVEYLELPARCTLSKVSRSGNGHSKKETAGVHPGATAARGSGSGGDEANGGAKP